LRPLREAGGDTVAARASDDPDRKTAAPTARGLAEGPVAFGQVLDSKGTDRTDRTDRKNPGSFYSVGLRATLSTGQWRAPASARCAEFPDPCTTLPVRCPKLPDRVAQIPCYDSPSRRRPGRRR